MRAKALSILLLAGCAAPAPPPDPPVPATTGGTLYVVDTHQDFFDDDGGKLHDPTQGPLRVLGEQGLQIVLRAASRGRSARLLGSAWADLESGRRAVLQVPRAPGDPDAALRVEALPTLSEDGAYATTAFAVKRRTSGNLPEETLESGTLTLPLRASLVWMIPGREGRMDLLLLHLASVPRAP